MIIETAILVVGGVVLGGAGLTVLFTPNLRSRFAMLFKSRTGHTIDQLTDPLQAIEQELAECQTKERQLETLVASVIATKTTQVTELNRLQEEYDRIDAQCDKHLESDELSDQAKTELAQRFAIAEDALESQKKNVALIEKKEQEARSNLADVKLRIKQAHSRKEKARATYQVAKATEKTNEITRATGSIDGTTGKIDKHIRKIEEMAAQQDAEHDLLQGTQGEQELRKLEQSQRVEDVIARRKAKKAQEEAITIKIVETEKEPRQ